MVYFGGEDFRMLKISMEMSVSPFIGMLYTFSYGDSFLTRFNSGATLGLFNRAANDGVFIRLGYRNSYIDPLTGDELYQRQAFMTAQSYMGSEASSFCDFGYSVDQDSPVEYLSTLSTNEFSVSTSGKNLFVSQYMSDGMGLASTIVSYDITQDQSLLRWKCSAPPSNGFAIPTLQVNQIELDPLKQDIAKNTTTMTRLFDDMIVTMPSGVCLAKLTYDCQTGCGPYLQLISSQNFVKVLPVQQIDIDGGGRGHQTTNIVIRGFISDFPSMVTLYLDFNLNVEVNCQCTDANILDPYIGSPISLPYQSLSPYTLGQPAKNVQIQAIQSNASCCAVLDVQFFQVAQSPSSFWAFQTPSMILTVPQTINKAYVQVWDYQLTYYFGNQFQMLSYTRFFSQEIVYSCAAAVIATQQELFSFQRTSSWVYDLERGNIDAFDLQWKTDNETACQVCSYQFNFQTPSFLGLNSGQIILQSDPTDLTLLSNWTGQEGLVGYQGYVCSQSGVVYDNTVKVDYMPLRLMSCFKSLIFSQTVDYFVGDFLREFSFYNNQAPMLTDCMGVQFTLLDIKDRQGTSYNLDMNPSLSSTLFMFLEDTRSVAVWTDSLYFSEAAINQYTATIEGSYNNGLSKYEVITMTINIKHPCLHSVSIDNSLPYFGNLSSSHVWYHDVNSQEPTVIQLTWPTSDELSCKIAVYQFTNSVDIYGSAISIGTEITIQTTPLSAENQYLVDAPSTLLIYEGYMIGRDESIRYGLPTATSILKVEYIDCLQYYQFDYIQVAYFINDDVTIDNYFISSQATRSQPCQGIQFNIAAQDSIGQTVLTSTLNVTLSSSEKRVSVSQNDITMATSPNQPYTVTLSGQYPDQTRNFPSLEFKLTFKDPCIDRVVFGENQKIVMGDFTYILMGPTLTVPINFYMPNRMYTQCGGQVNEITVTDSIMNKISHGQSTGLFYFKAQSNTLIIYSSNYADMLTEPFQVTVKSFNANYPNNFKEYSFTVDVKCQTLELLPSNDSLDSLFTTDALQYFIKDPALNIPISQFTPVQECGITNAITYNLEFFFGEEKLSKLPDFVSFDNTDPTDMSVTIQSNLRSDMVAYPSFTLHIIGKVADLFSGDYVYGTMKIPIALIVQNYGDPYLASDLTDIEVEINIPLTFKLPDIKDPDQDDTPSLMSNYPKFDQAIVSYKHGSYPTYTFIVNDPNLGGQSFSVSIKLTDNNPYQPRYSEYLFYLKVKAQATPAKDQSQEPSQYLDELFTQLTNSSLSRVPQSGTSLSTLPLSVKISSVSQTGLVKLTFNQDIILPVTNLTLINKYGLFESLKVVYEADQIIRNLTGYTVESIASKEIVVKLSFGQPLSISSGYGYDKLYIEFSKQIVISALANPNFNLSKDLEISNSVPPQLLSEGVAAKLETSTKATSNGLIMIICANVGLTLVGGFSMKKLWQLISTLQILVHYPLMNLPMQANVVMVLQGIQDISNLNIIPKDTLKSFMNKLVKDTSDGVSGQFELMGYNSSNTLHNMGLVALIVVHVALLILLVVLIGRAFRRSQKVHKLISSLKSKLMFNPLIQAQLKGYIKFNLSVMLSLQKVDDPWSLAINGLLTIYLVSSPCVFLRYLTKQHSSSQLGERATKQKYGSFIMNLKTTSFNTLAYTVLYLYRRLLLAFSIIVLSGNPLAQASIAMGSSLFMLVYLVHYRPHRSLNTRFFEVFNECIVLAITYLMMMNADFVTDDLLRYDIGWSIVGIIGLLVLINLANVFINMGKKISFKIKDFLTKRSRAKLYEAQSQIQVRSKVKDLSLENNQTNFDQCSNVVDNGQCDGSRITKQTSHESENISKMENQEPTVAQAEPVIIHLTSIRRNKIIEQQERMIAFASQVVKEEEESIQKHKNNSKKRKKRLSKIDEIDQEIERKANNTKLELI